jgi:cytochrome c biogenesis protein CcdA/thiol-disulfide isomerase/thioredoxin
MILLALFALLAGAGTALSPCVLPVLPLALSAGATGGRRRPLGIVTGLALSFTFATVALVYVIDALGLPDDLLRNVAIGVLIAFGAVLIVPAVAARVEAALTRLAPNRLRGSSGEGFGSGLLVGASLGFVYAPCAGPILAGVITVSASQSFTAGRLVVALAYGIGSAATLYVLMLGGRRLTSRLARRSGRLQVAMGVVMVLVGALMAAGYDTRFESRIAADLPSFLVNPTKELEDTGTARRRLADVRGTIRGAAPARKQGGAREAKSGSELPVLGRAPAIRGTQRWFNTPGDRPLSLARLRGRVVLVDFWTYTCINCLRTLPHVKAWDARYRRAGLTIIGVHTPEFPFEREASNVRQAVRDNAIHYPVAQDNEYATWNAFGNQYWPAKYLIDAQGRVRYVHFGEGEYGTTEAAIRSLLAEAGDKRLGRTTRVEAETPSAATQTPETYLGAGRAERFVKPVAVGVHDYGALPGSLPPDHLAYGGRWTILSDGATASVGAQLALDFTARRVFLVLGAPGGKRRLEVRLDGRVPAPDVSGADVRNGSAEIGEQRLYRLVELPSVGRHRLTLRFAPGISGYAFTFG